MIYLWTTRVLGWVDHDKVGTKWDDIILGPITDGATHASNPKRFSSATGGFTTAMEGQYLLVHPTAAPASAGGFTDPQYNGFYKINRAYDGGNDIDVEIVNGVHHDGLPLSETGLRFIVVDLTSSSKLPATTDWFVIRGTGIGGDFDVRFRESTSPAYSPHLIQASPFADWDNVGHAWSPSTRITGEVQVEHSSNDDRAWVWAVGDLTHFVIFAKYRTSSDIAVIDTDMMYVGDITAFHPADDLRPVVCACGRSSWNVSDKPNFHELNFWNNEGHFRMLSGDDATPSTGYLVHPSQHANTDASMLSPVLVDRSRWSGRFVRAPLILANYSSGTEEIRGSLKSIELGHLYGPPTCTPFGASLDRLRLAQCSISWNGSRVGRYVY
jgi:hypothetical protein